MEGFKQELKDYWFQFYERDSPRDSSGFEHVFVGERDPGDRSVGGFHSWLQLYLEEKAGHVVIEETFTFCQVRCGEIHQNANQFKKNKFKNNNHFCEIIITKMFNDTQKLYY